MGARPIDTPRKAAYGWRRVALLRSSFFIAIVSLFVLTGYSLQAFADCCTHEERQAQHAQSGTQKKAPSESNHCQCLCHQVISHVTSEPLRIAATALLEQGLMAQRDEFPPDALPVGIDYPPQLG